MKKWRDGSLHYSECKSCPYIKICNSGCQMTANAVNGSLASRDPLFQGKDAITEDFDIITDNKIFDYINSKKRFYVSKNIRFRDDKNIFIINIRWGNSMTINHALGKYLKNAQEKQTKFGVEEIGYERKEVLANLYFKGIIESEEKLNIDLEKIGLSMDLSFSPKSQKHLSNW